MTYRIATADAWKIFLALVATALLMVILMPFDNLGFVLAVTGLFGWLYSVTVELAKANGMATQRVTNISVLGVVCSFIFAYAGYFPVASARRYGVFLV